MTEVVALTERYTRAVELARSLHGGEFRKGTTIPYLSHVLSVSALVLEHGGNEGQAIAALLHDTAEDHGGQGRIDQLRADFGDTVADIVAACSDSLVEDRTKKAPWWERKVAYLDHLACEPVEAALVSAADKLHNARAILADYRERGDVLWERFNSDAGRWGSLWYYTRLTEILAERLAGTPGEWLAAELDRTVRAIVELAEQHGHDPHMEIAAGREREDSVRVQDRIVGCLLGGAIGDALGSGIEFDSWSAIQQRHGSGGVSGFVEAYGRVGAITDDTQMTMFTADGLIRASIRGRSKGICHPPSIVRHAYLRWLWTQGNARPLADAFGADTPDGWLVGIPALRSHRAPGNTCIGALEVGGIGTLDDRPNSSKGCGGVMRAAPAGFVRGSIEQRFQLGCETAVITHGHPSGYLPAGFLAAAVGELVDGAGLGDALDAAERVLRTWDDHAETAAAVEAGRRLGAQGMPTAGQLAELGGGWTGEEALAIAIACSVAASSFQEGVVAAVNHSGDSDSTGSITGNLLGALHGTAAIPTAWRETVELHDEIEQLARDAALELRGDAPADGPALDEWFERYPGS